MRFAGDGERAMTRAANTRTARGVAMVTATLLLCLPLAFAWGPQNRPAPRQRPQPRYERRAEPQPRYERRTEQQPQRQERRQEMRQQMPRQQDYRAPSRQFPQYPQYNNRGMQRAPGNSNGNGQPQYRSTPFPPRREYTRPDFPGRKGPRQQYPVRPNYPSSGVQERGQVPGPGTGMGQGNANRQIYPTREYAPPGHLGAWLNQHRGMPLQDQERMLRSEPSFNRLPQADQQKLVRQLHQMDQMPEAQRERRLARAEALERLSPQERTQVNASVQEWRSLPSNRQSMMKNAFQDLRKVPPDQRQMMLDSGHYRNMFSPQERSILSNLLRVEPYRPPE